ncbi:MAG: site-specific integrase, partial [Rhodospirillales bacterium]
MATIRKRGNKWQAQVRRAGQRSASRSFNFKTDAETWAREMERRADRGELGGDHSEFEHLTIKDVLIRYRDSVVPLKRS